MGKLLTWLPFKLYFRVQKSGMENLTSEPVIYAGNHQSLLDAFIFNHSVPSKILRNIYYLAKVKHFSKDIYVENLEKIQMLFGRYQ